MKPMERKIKQSLPPEKVPAYLRHLADAMENRTSNLPSELSDLPEPIAKLEMKVKARDGRWNLTIKVKAAPPAAVEKPISPAGKAMEAFVCSAGKPEDDYNTLKKRMKASFKTIGGSLAAQKLPEPEVLRAFLADSEQMMTFPGGKYGEQHYPVYRKACRQLVEACESRNRPAVAEAYSALEQVKKTCHKLYK